MGIYYLPARTDLTHYDFQVELEGAEYTFDLYFNTRSGFWFLSVFDADGELVVGDRKVVLGSPLLGRAVPEKGPPGALIAIDTSGKDEEAHREDLGNRVQLVYFDSTEL